MLKGRYTQVNTCVFHNKLIFLLKVRLDLIMKYSAPTHLILWFLNAWTFWMPILAPKSKGLSIEVYPCLFNHNPLAASQAAHSTSSRGIWEIVDVL